MTRLFNRFASNSIRSDKPLTDDEIFKVAPSIFAAEKHNSRSDRYHVIPTIDVLTALRREGFQPFMACQARTRDDAKRGHAKHLMRLRHESTINDDQANEIVLLNSHDGSCSYQMLSGVFRFVCSNGMVAGTVNDDIRVRHSRSVIDNVLEGAFRVLNDFEKVDESRELMQSITLSEAEQFIFGKSALALKYETTDKPAPVTEAAILAARRPEDLKNDVWTVFNRVQENLIKGGVQSKTATGARIHTRPVQGIDGNLKLNKAIWMLAVEMAKLKR